MGWWVGGLGRGGRGGLNELLCAWGGWVESATVCVWVGGWVGGWAYLHELTRHDGLLILLPKVEGTVVETLVVVLLQDVLPPFVEVLYGWVGGWMVQ